MYTKHVAWRAENFPIPHEEVEATLALRKFYVLDNPDADGRPVVYVNFKAFTSAPYVAEEEARAYLYMLEHTLQPRFDQLGGTAAGAGPAKMMVIIDVTGIRSPPLAFIKQLNAVRVVLGWAWGVGVVFQSLCFTRCFSRLLFPHSTATSASTRR